MALKLPRTLIAACLLAVTSSTVSAADNTSRRLQMLEQKVTAMQTQLRELTVANKKLREQLAHMTNTEPFDMLACDDRSLALQDKLDQLLKLGFKDNHPDVSNIKHQMTDLAVECQSNGSSSAHTAISCETRITKLRQQKDATLALGFQPTHPDIKSMTKLIDEITAECSSS